MMDAVSQLTAANTQPTVEEIEYIVEEKGVSDAFIGLVSCSTV